MALISVTILQQVTETLLSNPNIIFISVNNFSSPQVSCATSDFHIFGTYQPIPTVSMWEWRRSHLSAQKRTLQTTNPRYRLEIQVCQIETTSKMKLRIKAHPAVALILQHLRFWSMLFWCCWFSCRENKKDLVGGERNRRIIGCSFNTEIKMNVSWNDRLVWMTNEHSYNSSLIYFQWGSASVKRCRAPLTAYLMMPVGSSCIKFKDSSNLQILLLILHAYLSEVDIPAPDSPHKHFFSTHDVETPLRIALFAGMLLYLYGGFLPCAFHYWCQWKHLIIN